MPSILMLALALLCSTAWVQAQQDQYPQNPQNPPSGSSQAGTSAGETSVEGCLQGSNGNFTLTDKSGTTYQLSGDTSKLSKHVGHEVQITGSTPVPALRVRPAACRRVVHSSRRSLWTR